MTNTINVRELKPAKIDNRTFYSRLWQLTLPIALQSFMLASVAAADALMLGRIAQNEMAAVSLATQVQFVQNIFVLGITSAGSILGAQYWGKGDKKTMRELFNMMIRFSVAVSLIFFLGCELTPGLLMRIFTHDPVLIEIGMPYLRIAGWSYLLTGISQCYLSMMKVTDHVRESAVIGSSAVVMNIIFNAVLIFGLLGLPRMEARGAALATTIARALELLFCLILSTRDGYLTPDFAHFFKDRKELLLSFVRQCLPLMGGSLLWGVGFTSYTAIIGHLGADAAASNSIAAVIRDLACCVCNGIATAAAIMVGNELGAGNLAEGKAYGYKLRNFSFVLGFASTAFILAITPLVVRMVKLTPKAHSYLTGMMIVMAFYMIGRVVNTIMINGVMDSGGDTLFDMYSLAVSMWGLAIPLALAGAFFFHWPVVAVYACTCVDEVGKIPWVLIHFRKCIWVQDLTIH
ncbi:MAG: MATE family efflux transporter [Lachnospiraceae bacterium]|nr:MATE family efflux transporter [Lachnospiraceae bacterium]